MLVRSQDRRKITQQIEFNIVKITDNIFEIRHSVTGQNYGRYSLEEKAVEIMDLIERRFKRHTVVTGPNGRPAALYSAPTVFHLPEDKEDSNE